MAKNWFTFGVGEGDEWEDLGGFQKGVVIVGAIILAITRLFDLPDTQ